MSFAHQIFGKHLSDVTYEDVQNYFKTNPVETDILEFKSGSDKDFERSQTNVMMAVDSFLNSSGGLVIWGAPREKTKGTFTDDLTPMQQDLDKDTFIRRVASRIIPTPLGIRFQPVENKKSATKSFVYLIEVDQSPHSPHQINGKDYYVRLDGQKHPAPHHYLEALFKKITYPNLDVKISSVQMQSLGILNFRITLAIRIENLSTTQNEENLYMHVSFPNGMYNNSTYHTVIKKGKELDSISHENAKALLFLGEPYDHNLIIDYDRRWLDKPMSIIVRFGGKKSPLKATIIDFVVYNGDVGFVLDYKIIAPNEVTA